MHKKWECELKRHFIQICILIAPTHGYRDVINRNSYNNKNDWYNYKWHRIQIYQYLIHNMVYSIHPDCSHFILINSLQWSILSWQSDICMNNNCPTALFQYFPWNQSSRKVVELWNNKVTKVRSYIKFYRLFKLETLHLSWTRELFMPTNKFYRIISFS